MNKVVQIARSYIGTPYHHAQRKPGVGLDCAGLVICAGREAGLLPVDFDVVDYGSTPGADKILSVCDSILGDKLQLDQVKPGIVVVIKSHDRPCHTGIVGDYGDSGLSLIHASNNSSHKRVVEHRLMFSRFIKFVRAYNFRGS